MRSSSTDKGGSNERVARRDLGRKATSASASQFQTSNTGASIADIPCGLRGNMSPITAKTSSLMLRASIFFALLSTCGGWMLSGARFADVFRAHRGDKSTIVDKKEECRAAPPWDTSISEMQDAVNAFHARDYAPPVWARNAHLHTIVASGDMEKKLLGDRTPLGYWRERWPTPDGDFVDIDWLPADEPEKDAPEGHSRSRFGAAEGDGEEAASAGAGEAMLDVEGNVDVQSAINARLEVTPQVHNTEELKQMADLAERADGNSLGIGHPGEPGSIHEGDPSWMSERSRGKGGQGRGGARRLVLVLHGLEGSSTAPLTKRFSSVYTRNGFDVAAVNFRGCSGELSNFPVGYHLGFTADLLHVIEEIHRKFPDTWDRIYLSGFSLGGNVIIKFLGEQGDRARELGIYGAAVACVPFEPKIAAEKLERDPIGRYVYMPVFLGWMNIKAQAHAKAFPDKLSLETVQSVKTFTEFNSRITAPLFDFSSPDEFYDDVNASNYLSRVRVPLMVVNAKDDPFIDGNSLPEQERVGDAPVRLVYHNYGGHCGFMSGVLSNILQGKTPGHVRTWGRSWGGSWVPWVARGDPETLPEEFHAEDAAHVGAAAAAAAAASTVVLAPNDGSPIADGVSSDAGGGGGGGAEGKGDASEGEPTGEGGGGATLKEGRWLPTELARFVTHLEESLHKDGRSERPGARARMATSAKSDACAPEPSLKR